MAENIKGTLKMTRDTERVNSNGRMEEFIQVSGKMGNKMD